MPRWLHAARLADCPPGSAIERVVGTQIVAIFNVDGVVHALDGVCPHQGGPLGKGRLHDCIVTCPWHGWQFDVRNGQQQLSPSIVQPRFPVRVEEDTILVDVDDSSDEGANEE